VSNHKAAFANTLHELDKGSCLCANECERYGMTWGCDEDCPVMQRGECHNELSVEMYFHLTELGKQKELQDEKTNATN
jgi:hypothetical protein